MPYLIVKKGELEGQTIPLQNEKTAFGRAETSDVCLKDINISRRHAQILRLKNNVMAIVDLGSSNGTYVNDFPINRIFLMDGDEIRMGETVMTYCEGESEEKHPA
ncbi:MAG: FHA domain-containing protein, partial [Candidatus Sumerlaeota bacterium]|nr:FHA domain-containing protein [Candidatus Sumerlaeota bacterium]